MTIIFAMQVFGAEWPVAGEISSPGEVYVQ